MDQRKRAKRVFAVRVSEESYRYVAELAAEADVDASHMGRRLLTYAVMNMPRGWVPPRDLKG